MEPRHYVHHLPGRLRVRTPALKRNSRAAQGLRILLSCRRGVRGVEINPLTGSATVYYAPAELEGTALLRALADAGYLDLARTSSPDALWSEAAARAGRALARAAVRRALARLLGGTPLALLLALFQRPFLARPQ